MQAEIQEHCRLSVLPVQASTLGSPPSHRRDPTLHPGLIPSFCVWSLAGAVILFPGGNQSLGGERPPPHPARVFITVTFSVTSLLAPALYLLANCTPAE